jgi:hypothetical protein
MYLKHAFSQIFMPLGVGVLSGRVIGFIRSGFEILKSRLQPDLIKNRVIGFGWDSGQVMSGRVIRVIGCKYICLYSKEQRLMLTSKIVFNFSSLLVNAITDLQYPHFLIEHMCRMPMKTNNDSSKVAYIKMRANILATCVH